MASRLFHGSRPSKQKDKEEETVAKSTRSGKRTSLVPPVTTASKIPTHVSMFSRHRAKTAEEKTPAPALRQATTPKDRVADQRHGGIPAASSSDTAISRGRGDFGFAVRTEVSAPALSTKSSPPPRNRLRRKTSSNDQRLRYARSNASTSIDDSLPATTIETTSSPGGYSDPFPGSILGISLPAVSQSASQIPAMQSTPTAYATSSSRMANYMQRPPPTKTPVQDLTPPIPHYAARSSSTSTRYSESPGPFSRTSTPTSASSYSPGITQSSRMTPRLKSSTSPTRSRPPVTRRKIGVVAPLEPVEDQGLPALRESSSSSSTVKSPENVEKLGSGRVARGGRIHAPPPTPPLRLSSKRIPRPRGVAQASSEDEKRGATTRGRQNEPATRLGVVGSRIPASSASRSRIPPPRPSREGTPRLENETFSPIIRSNLSHLETTGHKRRESVEKALLVSPSKSDDQGMKGLLQRSPSSASTSSKRPQTSPDHARPQSPHLYSRSKSQSREQVPLQTVNLKQYRSTAPSPVGESPSKSPSRFGLFTRRIKSPGEPNNTTTEKPIKKGPAAGTGHEGYGKYARRGRSGSISTTASRGRSTSTDRTSTSYRPSSSRKSSFAGEDKPELDDFYRDRLEPVVIGGGGKIRENRNSRTELYRPSSGESSASLTSAISFGPPLATTRQLQSESLSSRESSLLPSQRDLMPPPRLGMSSRSHSSDSSSTLAHRRSLHRSQLLREAEPLRIPAPINTQALDSSTVLDSFDTLRSSITKTDSSLNLTDDLSEGHEGNWLRPKKPQQRVKLPKKWNFFQRAQNSPGKSVAADTPQRKEGSGDLPAAISKLPQSRFVPHYAMMDNSEPEDTDTLEDILHDIEDDLDLRNPDNAQNAGQDMPQREREHSMLLPSPPKFPTGFAPFQRQLPPAVNLDQRMPAAEPTMPQANPAPGKRLQQVGRIPKVVSKRDRLHRPPPHSFSRPFVRNPAEMISPIASEPAPDVAPLVEQPVRAVQTEPLPSGPWTHHPFNEPVRAPPTNVMLHDLDGEKEFLSFSPRQNSDVSGSSGSGVLGLTGMTAQLPRPNSLLKEDEVWNEYDELLDRVTSPESIEMSWPGQDNIINSFPTTDMSQKLSAGGRKEESPVLLSPRSSDSTTMQYSPPKQHHPKEGRSSHLEPAELSSPQVSFSEIYAGYGNRSSAGVTNRQSISSGSRYSLQSVGSRSGSRTNRDGDSVRRYTKVMADKINGAVGTSNSLRYSALMTARWLSFDRVLFSPVQEEIRNSRQDKVLVLDGLANDDWSSYCALTYPDATVYNLSAPRPLSSAKRDTENWQPPPNHRQIHHSSLAHPFPFPKGFFTAVVLRFPVATSESSLRSAVSECKRVLRPGGYLELCILDMDMVNMGNRARRAVRGLKVRMQLADPSVSLSPASDTVQKMLGRRGFENLSRCVVGVPVAGLMTEHGGSESPDEKHASLGEMLRDPAAGGSVPVTKMIATVGRWWWSRCYEGGETEESIWKDRALLQECEGRDTGFRLVICYAQKPLNIRRRTVSV